MANYKYQHYIPAGHQKLFSTCDNKSIFKYDVNSSIIYKHSQNANNFGGQNHLYNFPSDLASDKTTYLEKEYFSQDGEFLISAKKIINKSELTESDLYNITKYIANINNRHPEQLSTSYNNQTSTILSVLFSNDKVLVDYFSKLIQVEEKECDTLRKASSLIKMLLNIKDNLNNLCDISMNILYSDSREFILADRPFVGVTPQGEIIRPTFIDNRNNYFLPLSNKTCIHLNGAGQHLKTLEINDETVNIINTQQIKAADNFLIASSVNTLRENLELNNVKYTIK